MGLEVAETVRTLLQEGQTGEGSAKLEGCGG